MEALAAKYFRIIRQHQPRAAKRFLGFLAGWAKDLLLKHAKG